MATNIQNKADIIRSHIRDAEKNGCEYGEPDVRRIVQNRWPDLSHYIQEQIVQAVMKGGC